MNALRHPTIQSEIETIDRASLKALQEERLLSFLPKAVQGSGLLRELWAKVGVNPNEIRSLDDFRSKAPFSDKEMIRTYREAHNDPYGGMICCHPWELTSVATSSGTTGDPTPFPVRLWPGTALWPSDFWEKVKSPTERDYKELGLQPGDYVAFFVPAFRGPRFRLYQEAGGVPILFDHHPSELPRFIEAARNYRPKIMYMLSNPLIVGLEHLERSMGVDMVDVFSSFSAVIFGGEPLSARSRALLDRWRAPVFGHCGLGDVGMLFECRARDGMHAWEDHALVEVLDPKTGLEVADGERGELVVTALNNETAPLVRFRSEDLVKVDRRPCVCGRTHVRLWILGRAGDEIVVDGHVILPSDVWAAIEAVEETAAGLFQIIRPQRNLQSLKLRVGHEPTPDPLDLKRRLEVSVETVCGIRPDIQLVANEELLKLGPPHKIPRTAKV